MKIAIIISSLLMFISLSKSNGQSNKILNVTDDNNASILYIKDNGNVGIGLVDNHPRAKLQISNSTAFSKSSTESGQDAFYLKDLNGTAGLNNFGASIGFSRIGHSSTSDRRAAIAAVQYGSDEDEIGLAFFVHNAVGSSDLLEKMRVTYNNVTVDGNIVLTSDERFKKEIMRIDNSLQKVLNLNGVYFNWRTNEFPNRPFSTARQIGFIAQNVEKVLPEAVYTDEKGFKSVSYSNINALLVEAIKEQQNEIQKQEEEIEDLKSRLLKLEGLISQGNNNSAEHEADE